MDGTVMKREALIVSCLQAKSEAQMNMQAVFLHVLGDALGSVIVIVSAGIVLLVQVGCRVIMTSIRTHLVIFLPARQRHR